MSKENVCKYGDDEEEAHKVYILKQALGIDDNEEEISLEGLFLLILKRLETLEHAFQSLSNEGEEEESRIITPT